MTTPQDGNLPAALNRLADAVSALTDPKPHMLDTHTTYLDSLYTQLQEAIPGSKQHRTGIPGSQPPCWIDALTLLTEIDTATACWQPHPQTTTPTRLQALEQRRWRPQDTTRIDQLTANIETWVAGIKHLLTDEPHQHVFAPCPACGTKTVKHRDSGGDLVNQPALQITTQGCTCSRCHHVWAPSQFTFLARVIGCEPTPGICP